MKLALTTFIIPFAFVYSPELMSFPHVTWPVWREIAEVVLIQWIVSVAAYGYCFRSLGAAERAIFGVAGLLGFLAMTLGEDAQHWYWHIALISLTIAITVWAAVTRNREVVQTT